MTEENKQFLRDNYLTMLDREMAEHLGLTRGTVSMWCRRLGLVRPKELVKQRHSHARSEEQRAKLREQANLNENFVKNRFQKGHKRSVTYEVGSMRKDNRDGYWLVKVDDKPNVRTNWKYVHRLEWEKHYGAIPPNHHIVFLDGNKDNIAIENLCMIDDRVFAVMNRHYKFTGNAQDTRSFIDIARLKIAINDVRRRKSE